MGETASPAAPLRSPLRLHDDLRRDGIGHAALVGRDPIDNVVMMEDHDGAYYAWKQAVQRENNAPHPWPQPLGPGGGKKTRRCGRRCGGKFFRRNPHIGRANRWTPITSLFRF